MNYYPITIPTLNRYEKFKNCIESLKQNFHSDQTELIIGLDYPPSEKYFDGYNKIKNYIKTITGFKKITVFERTTNFGSDLNTKDIRKYALSKYEACIHTEDDNVFSPYFIDYMNAALNEYKDNDSIFAICAYSYPIDWKSQKDCILQSQYFSAWGMGIWKHKELDYINLLSQKTFRKQFKNMKNIIRLIHSPYNLYQLYYLCYSSNIPYCDITRSAYLLFYKKYVLMPTQSLSCNEGWDGTGEHCRIDFEKSFYTELNENQAVDIKNVEKVKSLELEKKLSYLIDQKKFRRIKLCFIIVSIFGFWPFDLLHFIKSRIKK